MAQGRRVGCRFHLRWKKLWGNPTFSCATVLAVGWKQYSHTQPLLCCHRSKSAHILKRGPNDWIRISVAQKYHISEKIKIQKSSSMRAWKWKLIRIYSFVATKDSPNLNREQLRHVGKNAGLGPQRAPLSHSGHSLSVWLDRSWNFSFPSHRVLLRKWGRVYECPSQISKHDANTSSDYLHFHCNCHHSKTKSTQFRKLSAGIY